MMIGVDVGGTFTDVVVIDEGAITPVKVSTDVHNTHLAVLQGAEEAGAGAASVFNHASTHGLNAVITRKLPKIAFLTTFGHRDILDIGSNYRPLTALTDASWRRPFGDASRPLVPRYLRRGIKERMKADGEALIPFDEEQARGQLAVLKRCGVEGVAICLINAYVNAEHEQRLRDLVREELGDVPVSISSETSPLAKEWARASTTTIDVFMKLIYGEYTDKLHEGLRGLGFTGSFNYANCAAQLIRADIAMEQPFEIVFAGPAAGTVASAHFCRLINRQELLCADIGGTSCDISMVSGGKPYVNTTFLLEHDLIVNALSNEVESIGAGGGSLVTISPQGEVLVGPGSAGADPGPACYGKGGTQPASTDTLVMMGVIDPTTFAGGRLSLDPTLSAKAFEDLDTPLSLDQRVRYAFNIGVNNVAEGINNIAIKHGIDPRDYSLVAFGAAGPMLLPACMDLVHAREVIVPPHPGLFSALGLVSTDQVYGESRSSYLMLDGSAAPSVDKVYREMEDELRARFTDVHAAGELTFVRSMDARLAGQTWETPFVKVPSGEITAEKIDEMIENFHQVYQARAGNRFDGLPVQGVTYRVEAVISAEKVDYPKIESGDGRILEPDSTFQLMYLHDEPIQAGRYNRESLRAGDRIEGPAVIHEALSTTFMLAGQVAEVGEYGELRITRA
ncbi:hydantoinase/oxoprolinase family protein [Cumulibacter manganitolerans]|uniref:hydantoinase/oxoprolinase family protein n=1 Tax=Cumulibacter manganitolerans TaxID=1884992 RepID=UPI001E509683|nr:hydantoinase/oxoprolinase family protein [Cumulibacter manganitolerans]